MKTHLKTVLSLTLICSVVAVLLAVTNFITAPIILEQDKQKTMGSLAEVLPGGTDFEEYDFSSLTLPASISQVYSEKSGGYVFKMITTGYAADFVIMCGIDKDGKVVGATSISSNETLGYEKTYGPSLIGADTQTIESVDVITGATKTTGAYKNAVKDALNAFIIIGGGTVDIRDEATILKDNLSAALPAAEGEFEEYFITEEIKDVSNVYKAVNGKGYVFVVGESFVATDENGEVISDVADDVKKNISDGAKKLISIKFDDIDLSKYEKIPTHVVKAQKTSSGNYVFELKANGYGINGDQYTASGEHIYIKVAVTKKGKIINCQTISQKESAGIGDKCADSSFYGQFNGKDEATYKNIDTISGATITTNGYVNAISKVFETVKILEGGA